MRPVDPGRGTVCRALGAGRRAPAPDRCLGGDGPPDRPHRAPARCRRRRRRRPGPAAPEAIGHLRRGVPRISLPCRRGSGRGLHGPWRGLEPRRGAEVHQGAAGPRPGLPAAVLPGGRDHGAARTPGDRPRLQPGSRRRRLPLLRDAVHPRPDPGGRDPGVSRGRGARPRRAPAPAPRPDQAARRRLQHDRLRAQPGGAAPRPQAQEHHAGQVRRDAGRRLGPGAAVRPERGGPRPRRGDAHPQFRQQRLGLAHGGRRGHAGLHEPGAGGRALGAGRAAQRRVQLGRDPVRAADGPGPLRGQPRRRGARPRPPR